MEPRISQSCATLTASLHSAEGKRASADEAKLDTQRIQAALDSCASGKTVELKAAPGRDSFLSGPLQLRAGVTLLVECRRHPLRISKSARLRRPTRRLW